MLTTVQTLNQNFKSCQNFNQKLERCLSSAENFNNGMSFLIKDLQRFKCRTEFTKTGQIWDGKCYNMSVLQQKYITRHNSNQKRKNMSGFESKSKHYVRICKESLKAILNFWTNFLQRAAIWSKSLQHSRFRTKRFTTCNILNLKFHNVSDLESRDYNVSVFESKVFNLVAFESKYLQTVWIRFEILQSGIFWIKSSRTCRILKPTIYTLSEIASDVLQRYRCFESTFWKRSGIDSKRSQSVSFRIEKFTMCQIWNEKFTKCQISNQNFTSCQISSPIAYNVADIETKYPQLVRYRFKTLQCGRF